VKAVVAAFNQEKARAGAFSVIVQLRRLIGHSTSCHALHAVDCSGAHQASCSASTWAQFLSHKPGITKPDLITTFGSYLALRKTDSK